MKRLGTVSIETWVEVPTKKVQGEQRYKHIKHWAPIAHELLHPNVLRALNDMVEKSEDGYIILSVATQHDYLSQPKYTKVYAVIQEVITIASQN